MDDFPEEIDHSIQTIIERFNNMEFKVDQLSKIVNNLSSVSIPDTAPEITTDKQEIKLGPAETVELQKDRSFPTFFTNALSLSRSMVPCENTWEVTITWLAPASR